jgi:hypothetical protein
MAGDEAGVIVTVSILARRHRCTFPYSAISATATMAASMSTSAPVEASDGRGSSSGGWGKFTPEISMSIFAVQTKSFQLESGD